MGKWTPSRAHEMEDIEIKDKRNLLVLSHSLKLPQTTADAQHVRHDDD